MKLLTEQSVYELAERIRIIANKLEEPEDILTLGYVMGTIIKDHFDGERWRTLTHWLWVDEQDGFDDLLSEWIHANTSEEYTQVVDKLVAAYKAKGIEI